MGLPCLLLVAACLVLAAVAAGPGAELVASRLERTALSHPGWWATPQEQERLNAILARNPSYDERTGLTSDSELARWWLDNQP
jgi:hypothetical protein